MSETRKLSAILFADIQGYTAMMQADERKASLILEKFHQTIKEQVHLQSGKVINNYGDGCVCTFDSAVNALRCAMIIQSSFQAEPKVPTRIGLHSGDVFFKDNNVYGNNVNIASRIESIGIPGAILYSEQIKKEIDNHPEFKSKPLGKFEFKNVDELLEVFALGNENFVIPKREELKGKIVIPEKQKRNWLPLVLGSVLLLFFGYWLFSSRFLNLKSDSNISEDLRQKKLAVMIFENETGDKDLEVIGKMASEWVTQGLMQIEDVKVLTPATVTDQVKLAGANVIKSLARSNGVEYVFSGNYYLIGDKLIFKSKLLNAKSGEVEYYLPDYQSPKNEPLAAVKELTERIMGYWLNKEEIENRKTTPPKYEAYKALLKGKELYSFDNEASIKYINEALAIDSTYFEGYLYLSFIYYYYLDDSQKGDEIFQKIKTLNLPLIPYQELVMNAAKAEIDGDLENQFRLYNILFDKYPDDKYARLNAGLGAYFSNRPERAAEILEGFDFAAMDMSLAREQIYLGTLFRALHSLGEYQKIIDLSNKHLQNIFPSIAPHISPHDRLLATYVQLGQKEQADSLLSVFENHNNLPPNFKAFFYNTVGEEFVKKNNNKDAGIAYFEKAVALTAFSSEDILSARYRALFNLEEYKKGIQELKQLLNKEGDGTLPLYFMYIEDMLMYYYAAMGQPSQVAKYQGLRAKRDAQYWFYYTDAFASMKAGNQQEAVENLKKAYADGWPFTSGTYGFDVSFMTLRGYAPFDEFIQEK